MDQKRIILLSFGLFGKEILDKLALAVGTEFRSEVLVKEIHFDLDQFYDTGRRQYNADKLLRVVASFENPHCDKVIGLFNIDLFIPILTFIFGQAQLGGNAAVASCYRLNNEYYGLKADAKILLERFTKVLIHELGHANGLLHCHNPDCVMRSGTYVEDIDQKERHLCANCRELL